MRLMQHLECLECSICNEDKSVFMICSRCRNGICYECNLLTNNKCAFCRYQERVKDEMKFVEKFIFYISSICLVLFIHTTLSASFTCMMTFYPNGISYQLITLFYSILIKFYI